MEQLNWAILRCPYLPLFAEDLKVAASIHVRLLRDQPPKTGSMSTLRGIRVRVELLRTARGNSGLWFGVENNGQLVSELQGHGLTSLPAANVQ